MVAEAVRQLKMGLGWVFLIRGDYGWIALAYWLDHIVSYWPDHIVSAVSYRIGCIISGNTGFYALAGYWLDGTDGLDGTFTGRGWDGPILAGARMRASPLAPERECHHWLLRGGGPWEVVADTNCVGAARERSICVREAK